MMDCIQEILVYKQILVLLVLVIVFALWFVYHDYPWFNRGGLYNMGNGSDTFTYERESSHLRVNDSFR